MPQQITIVWKVSSRFQKQDLVAVLREFKGEREPSKSEYELGVWKVNGLTVKYYEKKLVVQGNLDDYNKNLLPEIEKIDGLTLDAKNAAKLRRIFPSKQNAIICDECKSSSLLIEGTEEGLDIVFRKECGHVDRLATPLIMINSRILPDINILISNSLSRLIDLGYFKRFEIVIPEFIFDVVDQFKGKGSKDAVSKELANLRSRELKGNFKIIGLKNELVDLDKVNLTRDEDKIILAIAQLTNSVLITADQVLKDRAIMAQRPTIFIPARVFGKIKVIEELRNP